MQAVEACCRGKARRSGTLLAKRWVSPPECKYLFIVEAGVL